MTKPGGILGVCISPQIDTLDYDAWYNNGFKKYLRNLLEYMEEILKTNMKLELHIFTSDFGIPLPDFFLEALRQLGIPIIEHSKRELDLLNEDRSLFRFANQ